MSKNKRGAAGQQYAIIVGLIAVVAILAITSSGQVIKSLFARTSNSLNNVGGSSESTGPSQPAGPETPLYAFTNHTFTSCGATGRNGPLITTCASQYGTSWSSDSAFFKQGPFAGYQQWKVPKSGVYRFVAIGANGSATSSSSYPGGLGASITVEMPLSIGEELVFVVGQSSTTVHNHNAAAGGGTFVVKSGFFASTADADVIVVAGGGANGNYNVNANSIRDASLTSTGKAGQSFAAGTGGNGGAGGNGSTTGAGGGGGGLRSDGGLTPNGNAVTGLGLTNGAVGGAGWYSAHPSGFGGGGAGGNHGGAGGGGYNGGGAGNSNGNVGGGGSSFWNSGATMTASALRASGDAAQGSVAVTYVGP